MYLWQQSTWPHFHWDDAKLSKLLAQVSKEQGRLLGKMEMLGFDLRNETQLHSLTEEVLKSSEIEGQMLEPEQVRSSIARHLGMEIGGLIASDRDVEGVVEMVLDATHNAAIPLTEERLFAWHAALFPTGYSGMSQIEVGAWRKDHNGSMQVVSGPIGKEKIHYQAPPAERVASEMSQFLAWFEQPSNTDPLLKAGLAHLWFVTIHPLDDGNGRIARAIADLALSRSEQSSQRFYSMSAQIRRQHKAYYDILERTQKGELDVTQWQEWFLQSLLSSIEGAEQTLKQTLRKARFWERFAKEPLNQRQIKVLNKLLANFEGKLTTSKWAKIAKCSQDSAYRDILDLIKREALQKESSGGRSTSYRLNWE